MDPMVSGLVGLQQARITGAVQLAVARKLLDVQASQGQAAVKLIESTGRAMIKPGDALVAAATGLGGTLDIHA